MRKKLKKNRVMNIQQLKILASKMNAIKPQEYMLTLTVYNGSQTYSKIHLLKSVEHVHKFIYDYMKSEESKLIYNYDANPYTIPNAAYIENLIKTKSQSIFYAGNEYACWVRFELKKLK